MSKSSTTIIPLADVRSKMKARHTPKGRQVDPQARADVAALLATGKFALPARRDLLIEYLHLLQDKFLLYSLFQGAIVLIFSTDFLH